MHALIEQVSQSNQPLPLAANGESTMANTLQRTRITPIGFALLALGAISLSSLTLPAMAGDDAPDAGTKNPSTCRDLVNHSCLTKPRDDQSGKSQDTRNQDKAAEARTEAGTYARAESIAGIVNSVGIARYDSSGRITQVDYPKLGFSDRSYSDEAIIRVYRNGQQKLVYVSGTHDKPGSGGNGGAPGQTGSRHTLSVPNRSTQTAAAPPKAATPKSTTTDKATNTMTRDYRTGATAAPGGPPPAAASGSTKATAEQLAAQSGTRDHRH
jgi:hypothetical protein